MLGPALVTADEIVNPMDVPLQLSVNGALRQDSSTASMTVNIPDLIAFASRAYTLYPGDVILTGTPEGVGPVRAGDVITAGSPAIGSFRCVVHA
jgi:2-keto-4-pentenoate hydratase/2-oxohepta-3-ene-1,7-dioic acid hydratase in catechol pathway